MQGHRGFSLIELVVVIVLLGIVAVMVSQFLGTGVMLYRDNAEQQRVLADVRFAMERLNREVARAHPYSLRDPMGNSRCIEFIQVAAAGYYDPAMQGSSAAVTLQMLGSDSDYIHPELGSAVVVGARLSLNTLTSHELYTAAPSTVSGSVALLGSVTVSGASRIVLPQSASFTWLADSPARRYLVLDRQGPVAWCIQSGELVRYSNYGWLPSWSGVPVSASAALMASTVTAKSQFSVVAGNLNHNQMVNAGLWLGLSGGGELILSRRMQVNYVP